MSELIGHINNKAKNISISNDSAVFIDSEEYFFNIIQLNNDSYLLKIDNKIYEVTARKLDNQKFSVVVNGNLFEIEILTALQERAKKLLEERSSSNHKTEIKAPMPGMILKVKKQTGETVESGEPVIILEAMKMENELRAPVSGILKELFVEEGNPVEKGIKLFVIES